MWAALAVSTVLAAAPADAGPITIKNDRFTYGFLGPERKDDKVIPGDILWIAFDIDGLTVADDGKVRYSTAMQVLDKDGKTIFEEKNPTDRESVNALGGSRLPCWSRVDVGANQAPGDYTVRINVADKAAPKAQPAVLERKFTIVPPTFGIILAALGYDKPPASPPPAPPVAVPGQTLLVFFTVTGFDSKPGKSPTDALQGDVAVELTVLDESGKPTLAKPFSGEVTSIPNAEEFKNFLPFQFPLPLNRPGKFTLVMKATDKQGNKPAVTQKLDLTVVEAK